MSTKTVETPTPPFKTKKAVKEAMALGSRWALTQGTSRREGTVVRVEPAARWIRWDSEPVGLPARLRVADTREWTLDGCGFTISDGHERWSLVAPAPADPDLDALARLARRPNGRYDVCGRCGTEVGAFAGYAVGGMRAGQVVYHHDGDCPPEDQWVPQDWMETAWEDPLSLDD